MIFLFTFYSFNSLISNHERFMDKIQLKIEFESSLDLFVPKPKEWITLERKYRHVKISGLSFTRRNKNSFRLYRNKRSKCEQMSEIIKNINLGLFCVDEVKTLIFESCDIYVASDPPATT